MTIHFTSSVEDYSDWTRWYFRHVPEGEKAMRSSTVYGFLLACIIAGLVTWQSGSGSLTLFFGASVIGCIAIYYLWPAYVIYRTNARITRQFSRPENAQLFGPTSFQVNAEGIVFISERATALYKWASFHRIIYAPDHLYLTIGSLNVVIIPRAKIGDAEFDAFVAQVRALHAASTEAKPLRALQA